MKKRKRMIFPIILSMLLSVTPVNALTTENIDELYTPNGTVLKQSKIPGFSEETADIIEKHKNDFNVNNFWSKMKQYGGYENYLKKYLGGVFAKYAGEDMIADVSSEEEFQEVAEYVLGLMTIWGFDYCNNNAGSYGKWGSDYGVRSDAFYPKGTDNGNRSHAPYSETNIDKICSGSLTRDSIHDGLNMTVDCDLGIDMILKKAGLYNIHCYEVTNMINRGAQRIYKVSDLQVGDLVECYTQKINKYGTPSGTFGWPGWNHVCLVGKIDKAAGTMTLYDTGHLFTNTCNPMNVRSLTVSSPNQYATDWVGIRWYKVEKEAIGWKEVDGEKVYLKSNGKKAADEWMTIDGKKYYFLSDGSLAKGTTKIDGKLYYFRPTSGSLYNRAGWGNLNGERPYFNSDGSMKIGTQKINGKLYYFLPKNGLMYHRAGWGNIGGERPFFNADGTMKTGTQKIYGRLYYFRPNNGLMYHRAGWGNINGDRPYFYSDGHMATGFTDINGKKYYFDPDTGLMVKNQFVGDYYIGDNGVATKNKPAETTTRETIEIRTTALRIRKGPGTGYDQVGMTHEKDVYDVYDIQKADGYTWYKIGDNKWVADDGTYVKYSKDVIPVDNKEKEEPKGSKVIGQATVKTPILRIRSGPGTDYDLVGLAYEGSVNDVYEIGKSSEYTWYRIGDGKWIADDGTFLTYKAK